MTAHTLTLKLWRQMGQHKKDTFQTRMQICFHCWADTLRELIIMSDMQCKLQIIHLRAERDVLRMVNHPGLVNFLGGFQDKNCVYFVMEYVCGGEFFRHLKAKEK